MVIFQYASENRKKEKKRTSEQVITYNSFPKYALKVTLSNTDDARINESTGRITKRKLV